MTPTEAWKLEKDNEQLRARIAELEDSLRGMVIIAELKQARIAELEARLEIDHCYQIIDGKQTRVEIPPNERGQQPDGIECRNETIKLLDARIIKLEVEIERLRKWDRLRQEDIMTLGQEVGKLEAALTEIARAPDLHPDGDWSASSLVEIAHAALRR